MIKDTELEGYPCHRWNVVQVSERNKGSGNGVLEIKSGQTKLSI